MDKEKEININGLLRTSDTITGSFQKLRFVTLASFASIVVCVLGCIGYTSYTVSSMGDKIYVLDKGVAMTATRGDVMVNRADEIREQSRRLHQLLFTVSPNREMVKHNIETALKFCDKSVYNYYKDVDERGFYRRIAQTGAAQDIVVDSVVTRKTQYPYPVVTYAKLYLTRQSSVTVYNLVSRCSMLDVTRNPDNLNGLWVERFEVIRNDEVETRKR
jgi:conjugative transposon TraK protein